MTMAYPAGVQHILGSSDQSATFRSRWCGARCWLRIVACNRQQLGRAVQADAVTCSQLWGPLFDYCLGHIDKVRNFVMQLETTKCQQFERELVGFCSRSQVAQPPDIWTQT